MTTAHDLMKDLRDGGAELYAASGIARDHSTVTRRVRRDRAVRTSLYSLAGAVTIGAVMLGASARSGLIEPIATPSPLPSSETLPVHEVTIGVSREGSALYTVDQLATAFGLSHEEAREVLIAALPPEAGGSVEGWLPIGEWTYSTDDTPEAVAADLVSRQLTWLEGHEIPRDRWHDTIVIASIVAQQSLTSEDFPAIASVILNRLDEGMTLDLRKSFAYYNFGYEPGHWGDPDYEYSEQFDFVTQRGLPAEAIGPVPREALDAVANPAPGDWMYLLVDYRSGRAEAFLTEDEFDAARAALD